MAGDLLQQPNVFLASSQAVRPAALAVTKLLGSLPTCRTFLVQSHLTLTPRVDACIVRSKQESLARFSMREAVQAPPKKGGPKKLPFCLLPDPLRVELGRRKRKVNEQERATRGREEREREKGFERPWSIGCSEREGSEVKDHAHLKQKSRKLPVELLPPPSQPDRPTQPRARTRPSRSNPCTRRSPAASASWSLGE